MLRAMGHWANVPSQSQDINIRVAGLLRLAVRSSIFFKISACGQQGCSSIRGGAVPSVPLWIQP